MDASRYAQVKEIFLAAQARPQHERGEYLSQVCGGDQSLLEEVRSLLAHNTDAPLFDSQGPPYGPDSSVEALPPRARASWGSGTLDLPLEAGARVGDYVVEGLLGSGAFGTVYRGVHPVIGKRVAIKLLSTRYSQDPTIVSRFISEARAVNKIGHSGIVDIFAFGQLPDGRHYHVMELVEGRTLAELLAERGPLTAHEALELLTPVARALDAAGAAGIAHRDLKPANILIGRGDAGELRPKLLDFGVAKLLDEADPREHRTDTGMTLGTPSYMAPEQCNALPVDHRADIYAFGVVLYQLLTGALPFEGPNAFVVMAKHVNDPPPPPESVNPLISAEVSHVVQWLLAKRPEDRPQRLAVALEALAAAARGEAPLGLKRTDLDTLPERPGLLASTPAPELTVGPLAPPASSRLGLVLGALTAAAMVTGGLLWATRERPALPPPAPEPRPALAPAPPLPASVRVTLRGVPAEARVVGPDGDTLGLGSGPFTLPRGTEPVVLTVEAEGFLPGAVQLRPEADQGVEVQLQPAPAPAVPRAAPARSPARAPPPPAAPPKEGPSGPRPNDLEPW
jgi:serine/threonine protein kinase